MSSIRKVRQWARTMQWHIHNLTLKTAESCRVGARYEVHAVQPEADLDRQELVDYVVVLVKCYAWGAIHLGWVV